MSPPQVAYAGIVSFDRGGGKEAKRLSIRFSPPNRYRRAFLESDGREGRTVVKDGATWWVYDPVRRKAWKGEAPDPDDKFLGPEAEFELMARNYEQKLDGETLVAGQPCWRVELRPVRGEGPARTFCVNGRHGLILQAETRRPDGTSVFAMRYESLDFSARLDTAAFAFRPPKGTLVVPSRFKPGFMDLEEAKSLGGADPHVPGWLPTGYIFESVDLLPSKRGAVLHLRFSDGISVLSLFQCPKGARLGVGGIPGRTLKLAVGRAQLFYKDDDTVLEWRKDGLRFVLVGRLSPERLRQVAESVP